MQGEVHSSNLQHQKAKTDVLPIKVPTGIHEIQPVEICVYSGPICGRNPRKGAPTLILDLSQDERACR